ncbi:MAG TPA: ABC transporter permease [[Clostridium] spiroforme]|uniref:ABC transporter permease n=1 Tax=Thomasclavelia spiroformis TaxID=29348 RepID=A0A921KIY2_9FIRM|nr:ABC transporter permease [Thomasclavelia spiroformis]
MGRLVKNELIKLFKKKSLYVTLIIIFVFLIFCNIMYKSMNNSYYYGFEYSEQTLKYLNEQLSTLDPEKSSDISLYIDVKSQIDLYEMMGQYENHSWQQQVIGQKLSSYFREKAMYEYGEEKDTEKASEIQAKIDDVKQKLDTDDWMYFANQDLEEVNKNIANLEQQEKSTDDKQTLQSLAQEIESAKVSKIVAEYRIDKGIKYGNDYLNRALDNYESSAKELIRYDFLDRELTYEEKTQYNDLLENREVNKYIIENNINDEDMTLKTMFENFFSQFGIFIIVILVMVAGTIVSEEFNKGTIKLLLVKPYSRNKILASKFVTSLIMIVIVVMVTALMELLIGGVIFGFDSLSIPVLEYDFNANSVQAINVFVYFGIQLLTQLPMIILLTTLAFALSTLFTNSALAITIALLGYMSTTIINQLAISFDIQFLKYFVTMNWDLSQYLFGGLPYMEGMSMPVSIVICIVYFLIMVIPTWIVFKRRNIKNI